MEDLIARFVARLGNLSKPVMWTMLFSCMVCLGFVDYFTGYEASFALFYLFPVTIAAWFLGQRTGMLFSLVGVATWYVSNHLSGQSFSSPFIPYWNAGMRLGFFLVVTILFGELREAFEKEKTMLRYDFLTGVCNARAFYEIAAAECLRANRYFHPLTVAYIDLDEFKEVNDQFGHQKGDQVLKLVATTIRQNIRRLDTVARLGGDEFVLLLPETDLKDAQRFLPRLRDQLLSEMQRHNWSVTFSMGVLTCTAAPSNVDEVMRQADDLMYEVKNAGKNAIRYSVYPEAL
jgi:diguanylate cyclase (GGDEF)-like protein